MSTAPRPYPTYAPDLPSRFRWVPPLFLGVAVGGLIGCLATFVVLELGKKRSQANEVVAERFNTSNALNGIPGIGDGGVTFTGDTTHHLGRYFGGRPDGSAVYRRVQLRGTLQKGVDPAAFTRQLKTAIDAELNRWGASTTGGGSSSTSGPTEARHTEETSYYTRDGRRGHLDLDLVVRDGRVEGTLIITEGR
jgi:hypothetical protein